MIDKIKKSSFLELDERFYTKTKAQKLDNPYLISSNLSLAKELGIDEEFLNSDGFIKLLNGEIETDSFASAYAGHQFGYFVPNLGDGRALNLGQIDKHHLQLKGSGLTAYSRDGDGRAVLRSSIREYLVSEAMYGLGIPTTRALGLIGSDTNVRREKVEKGAIVLRIAPSWIRFGSFEFAYLGKNKKEQIKALADYVIAESYPYLKGVQNCYEELYYAIVDKTVELMALWQSVGFMHGVMNTDNMSIDGLTIDYGPYSFMEQFDKGFICNLSDHEGRYSYENQPFIAQWNLLVLAKMFGQICDETLLENYANTFIGKYKKIYFDIMFKKLGLSKELGDDKKLVSELLKAMQDDNIDYTSFFYQLSSQAFNNFDGESINDWLITYKKRLEFEDQAKEDRIDSMKKINPKYILRNYMLQDAIDKAEQGDFKPVNDLLKIAINPYAEHKEYEHYIKPSENINGLRCSCSS